MVTYVVCEVDPWSIPNFDHIPISLGFARKIDFLLADIDGDGYITMDDASKWDDADAIRQRRKTIETNIPNWKDEQIVQVQIGNREQDPTNRETQTWFDEDQEWSIPWNQGNTTVGARLLFLRKSQKKQRAIYEKMKNTIEEENQKLDDVQKIGQSLGKTDRYKQLERRINHIYRTYVRL